MFERVSAIPSALRSASPAGIISTVQTGITAGVLVVAAAWVANSGYGDYSELPSNWYGAHWAAIQEVAEPPRATVIEPVFQDTIFIVGSDSEADSLRGLLAEDAAIRHTLALAPIRDEVLVATTDEEAEFLVETLLEGNKLLASLNRPEVRVVNLRTP